MSAASVEAPSRSVVTRALQAPAAWLGVAAVLGAAAALQPLFAAAALVGGGLGAVGLRQPGWMIAATFVAMLFDSAGITAVKVDGFPITASKLAVLGTMGLWVVHARVYAQPLFRWHPVLTAMALVVCTTAVGVAVAGSYTFGKFTLLGLAMMTVLVTVVYTILASRPLDALFRFLAVAYLAILVLSLTVAGARGPGDRASGTLGDPNEWATLVLLVTPTLIGGLAHQPGQWARALRLALAVLGPLALLNSESRASLLVLALVSPAWMWIMRGQRADVAVAAGAGLILAPSIIDVSDALERFHHLLLRLGGNAARDDASLAERSELLRQGVQLFLDNWAFGAGPGNFERATGFIGMEMTWRPAHNTYLEIAAEQGLFGLVPVVVFMAVVARTLWDAWRAAPRDHADRVLGVAAGLAGLALMAVTLGLLTFAIGYLVLGFALAIVAQANSQSSQSRC